MRIILKRQYVPIILEEVTGILVHIGEEWLGKKHNELEVRLLKLSGDRKVPSTRGCRN